MKRITVYRRLNKSYIAFKDSNPFEWQTGISAAEAIEKLKKQFPELKKETEYTIKKQQENKLI